MMLVIFWTLAGMLSIPVDFEANSLLRRKCNASDGDTVVLK